MSLFDRAFSMGEPNDDQANGQGPTPPGPVAWMLLGFFLLALAAWVLWSAIHGGDAGHWIALVLLVLGSGSAFVAGANRLRRRPHPS